jgi:hypothetical protein
VASVLQQQDAFGCELRASTGPVEQHDADLGFQTADPSTDGGLHAVEPSRRRREASLIDGHEGSKLIERHTVQHSSSFHLQARWIASRYTGFSDANAYSKIRPKGSEISGPGRKSAGSDFLTIAG